MKGWGYLPQRTSTFGMGSARYYKDETFGSDVMRNASDPWEIARRTTALLRDGLSFARDLGIKTGVGFEPYKLPASITDALPPEALANPAGFAESATAKKLLERRLADLLERYPDIDYVWLWEDEKSTWESLKKNVGISTAAFIDAHAFLKRHAPEKRLVAAGWGGFTRHFHKLHESLPDDVIFSALGSGFGWDPLSDDYGTVGARERWPIPWLEDDASMWFPQFRASRIAEDMRKAKALGCQGMLGIHWRHRIVDPTATYFAKAAWNADLTPSRHYFDFAATLAGTAKAGLLGQLLNESDTGGGIASTYLGGRDERGLARRMALSGDYTEAFEYRKHQPGKAMMVRQQRTAARFKALARAARGPLEKERLDYLSGFVGFLVPYTQAYADAHAIDRVLLRATELRKAGQKDAARDLVSSEAVPIWVRMLPQVREAVIAFQNIVATRGDLGQLASMQNKFVRIAVERLKLSLEEFSGTLPADALRVYRATLAPEAPLAKLFMPSRPSLLRAQESLRLYIIAPTVVGSASVLFHARQAATGHWSTVRAKHEGRGVYSAQLGPFPAGTGAVEYKASAGTVSLLQDPPAGFHIATILG